MDLDENGSPTRWRGENSWGKEAGENGYYVMSDEWFTQYTYQVVVNEPSATSYTFKFASADWSSEFAVQGAAPVVLATEQPMASAPGHGTESSLVIPQAGDYVFSFRLNTAGTGGQLMVSKCR